MSRTVTYGEPEWVGTKQRSSGDPYGFWQVRIITEYRPCFIARLFGYVYSETIRTYTHICDTGREEMYRADWMNEEGTMLRSFEWDDPEYQRAGMLTDHVRDFIKREKMLKLQQQIIDRSRV